jgi:hypothetical protein
MSTEPISLIRTRGRNESVYNKRNVRRVLGRATAGNADEINRANSDNVTSFLFKNKIRIGFHKRKSTMCKFGARRQQEGGRGFQIHRL